jgi:aryl-alcohol dehydrogenase-like predicted oxidoreductase
VVTPLAGVFLTGKYRREEASPEGSRYGLEPRRIGRNHCTEEAFAVVEVVEAIATEKGCTPGQLALAWCKEQPSITSPIIGPRSMEQLEDNVAAANFEITEGDRERLDDVASPGGLP